MDIRIIRSEKSWIEGEAVQQLENLAKLSGVMRIIGFPDLHQGKGAPIGAAFLTEDWIYPFYAGNDIGCSLSLWQLDLLQRKVRKEKLAKKLERFEDQDITGLVADSFFNEINQAGKSSLGSIGSGNHFAELQVVEKVFNQQVFNDLNLDEEKVMLLIHSGSRYLGESILRAYVDKHRDAGVLAASGDGQDYLIRHDAALSFAAKNREMIAFKVMSCLDVSGKIITDICHNCITKVEGTNTYIHRKGSARADQGVVMIAGTRGTLSYLVKPIGDQADSLWSIAHGAGRKYGRNQIKDRLKGKIQKDQLRQTRIGGFVICDDNDLLFEEAPEAYKDISTVIADLLQAGLIEVVATFKPIVTYKRWGG
jgi:release factor H-coupled RctB family protein